MASHCSAVSRSSGMRPRRSSMTDDSRQPAAGGSTRKRPTNLAACCRLPAACLEEEPRAELGRPRVTDPRDIFVRLTERCAPAVALIALAEVGGVEYVEELSEQSESLLAAKRKELRRAHVE